MKAKYSRSCSRNRSGISARNNYRTNRRNNTRRVLALIPETVLENILEAVPDPKWFCRITRATFTHPICLCETTGNIKVNRFCLCFNLTADAFS